MVRQYTLTALCLLPLMSYAVSAEDTEKKPEYTASAELGFLYKTGNTKSADIKAGFNLQHEKDKWRSVVAFNILAKKLEKEFLELLTEGPSANDYYNGAKFFADNTSEYEMALKWINTAIEKRPEAFWMQFHKARILNLTGLEKDAILTAKKTT